MTVKGSFMFETLSTLITSKRLLSCVNSPVIPEVYFCCEAPSTLLASERLLARVNF